VLSKKGSAQRIKREGDPTIVEGKAIDPSLDRAAGLEPKMRDGSKVLRRMRRSMQSMIPETLRTQ
jgi:hypothetical protein